MSAPVLLQEAWRKLNAWTGTQRTKGAGRLPRLQAALRGVTGKAARRAKRKAALAGLGWGAKRAVTVLEKKPGLEGKAFFRAFWGRKCYQFANKLLTFYHGRQGTSVYRMQNNARKAAEASGGQPTQLAGRSTRFRGWTLAELGEAPDLAAGTAVHVKIQFEKDKPYHTPDDYHHWVTYVGDGLFVDSLHEVATGAKIDDFLKGWVQRTFWMDRKGRKFKHLHNAEYATAESLASGRSDDARHKFKPKPGLQSRVSATYDPAAAKARA